MKNLIHGLNALTTVLALQLPYIQASGQSLSRIVTEIPSGSKGHESQGFMGSRSAPDAAIHRKKLQQLKPLKEMKIKGHEIKIFEGGVGTGGGDFASQEVRSIVSDLPSILVSKGLQYFPEIDIDELEKVSKSFVQVKLVGGLLVDGSFKAMLFDQKDRLIMVDPDEWNGLGDEESAKLKKQALVFHEVLGLMGLEGNNDYSISNRLLGLHFLQALNILKFSNQIIPRDHLNPQVIYWRTSSTGRITIFHCLDRKIVSTCQMLGNRSYTQSELQQSLAHLQKKNAQELSGLERRRNFWKAIGLGSVIVAVVILAIVNAPIAALAALKGGFVSTIGGVSMFTSLFGSMIWAKAEDKVTQFRETEISKESVAKRITEQQAGSADFNDFDLYARYLNEFLINQPPVANGTDMNTKP